MHKLVKAKGRAEVHRCENPPAPGYSHSFEGPTLPTDRQEHLGRVQNPGWGRGVGLASALALRDAFRSSSSFEMLKIQPLGLLQVF
jgi:hypothetical protein